MTFAHVYWQVSDDLAITCTEKAGATSINSALSRCRKITPQQIKQRNLTTRIYLRHPITRFASVYAYFAANGNFQVQPSRARYVLDHHPTIEQFTDAVLNGVENEHWLPQLAQHEIDIDQIHRFEDINKTWPTGYPLGHYNKGRIEKPEIIYKLNDLQEYYRQDLDAWDGVLE